MPYSEKMQKMDLKSRYVELIRLCIPYNQVASLDVFPDCNCMPCPPANLKIDRVGIEYFPASLKRELKTRNKQEVLPLFRGLTHMPRSSGAFN